MLMRMDNKIYQKAVELINRSHSVLITTHTKVDGDAVGCCVALSETLASLGKKVQLLFLSPLPDWYGFLLKSPVLVLGKDLSKEQLLQNKLGRFDLIIIADTNSRSQLPDFDEYLKQTDAHVLVIDHHKTADGLGEVELVDAHAAAASCVVLDLLKFAGWPITPKIAQALFVGIATDTGWFHFSNTDAVVLRCCTELAEAGANPPSIYHNIYQSFSAQRFRLMTAMLNTLELHFDGRYATQYLTQQDFKTTGAKYEDTENLIDQCQHISSIEIAALFVESPDGKIRCSLRSRGAVDVCKIAQKFAGGGHSSAAGTYLPGPIDNAKKLILAEVKKYLGK
jgi:phosphoesterase RecJ-like protein